MKHYAEQEGSALRVDTARCNILYQLCIIIREGSLIFFVTGSMLITSWFSPACDVERECCVDICQLYNDAKSLAERDCRICALRESPGAIRLNDIHPVRATARI